MKTPLRQRSLWLHASGIFLFMTLPFLFSPDLVTQISLFQIPPFQREFLTYFLMVCFFYASYLVFIPRFFYPKKYIPFAVCILISLIVIVGLPQILVVDNHHRPPMNMPFRPHRSPFHITRYLHYILSSIGLLLVAFILKLDNISKQLKQDKLNAELAYLKTQINPHFLFNTLNSIYALAIQQSADTAEAVVKLSGMMRYVLNDAHQDLVSLSSEESYINDYISLQKLRLTRSTQLNIEMNVPHQNLRLAPLLLIPFIENAFVFGANPEKNSQIKIELNSTPTGIHLFVQNDIVNPQAQNNGLGLNNTRNRLEMLYPNRHVLLIESTELTFTVSLTIHV